MAFAMTRDQILNRTKDVTRRQGWLFLKPGDRLTAVTKGQGLKRGEKVERLAELRVVSVRREPLGEIQQEDVIREGFPGMTPEEFIRGYRYATGIGPGDLVTRIQFEYVNTLGDD